MEQPLSILHILSNLSLKSGVASVVMNYCRRIDREKIKFSFLYFDEVNTETYIDELKKLGADIYFVPRKGFLKEWKRFCTENYGRYDIVHNHQTFLAPLLIRVKKQLGAKKLLTHAHATKFSDTNIKGIRNGILSFPSRFISDALVACSKDAGVALFGKAFKRKGKVIHNAINTDVFIYNEQLRTEMRKTLDLGGSFVIGHVGNMTPPKNHSFLLDVFREALQIRPDAKLLLIGDGYLRAQLEEKIEKLGLRQKVLLLGVQSDVFRYFNAMDVFLFPSLFEGLGIVLVEAQTNGLKCVYSDKVPMEADCNTAKNIRLSLKAPAYEWAKQICSVQERTNNTKAIQQNGYDISLAANELIEYYISVVSGDDDAT
ncbi:MAG: glycosyltransferase [Clostridia bacterium]|nr:glycosyltransferase [Clostridia bacterium]